MRNIIDITDLSVKEIDELIAVADDIIANPQDYSQKLKGKKLATLFFEPSTRTRLSFEAAMIELGGEVLGFESGGNSSATKGESVRDTFRVVGNYADVIAMRHPIEGAASAAAAVTPVPVINAGDGGHCHPTQTLADLLTIHREIGKFDNLTIGLVGDLKYGRTVHSLINALVRYNGVKFILVSPKELCLPKYMLDLLDEVGASYIQTEDMEKYMSEYDVLYMTRIQKERFDDIQTYERLKDSYILNAQKLSTARPEMRVLHPLPRVNEINSDVDDDPRAAYFRQTFNGKIMRMSLILKVLSDRSVSQNSVERIKTDKVCKNKKCITLYDNDVPSLAYINKNGKQTCAYCDTELE